MASIKTCQLLSILEQFIEYPPRTVHYTLPGTQIHTVHINIIVQKASESRSRVKDCSSVLGI